MRTGCSRRIHVYGPKRKELMGGWRKFHEEKLHNLYSSPNIIRVIKSRRLRWVTNVVLMKEMRKEYKILVLSGFHWHVGNFLIS
jgi:hypothetical protein